MKEENLTKWILEKSDWKFANRKEEERFVEFIISELDKIRKKGE
jgi:hypothetical protein